MPRLAISCATASQRLYLLPHFFEGKAVEYLLAKGVSAAGLNDDITGHMSHIDTTTFHTDGMYEQADEEGVIRITKGYRRDHRPELNQFGLKLIVEGQAGIPMIMQALSGNDNVRPASEKRFAIITGNCRMTSQHSI